MSSEVRFKSSLLHCDCGEDFKLAYLRLFHLFKNFDEF